MWKSPQQISRKVLPSLLIVVCAGTAGLAQTSDRPEGFENCKVLTDDQARLDCFKRLLTGGSPGVSKPDDGSSKDLWRLVKTPDPRGGPDAVAIMRTADTTQSDPDLAGLMIRCQEKHGFGVLLALVRPLPPRSKRDIAIGSGAKASVLRGEASDTGTALILPIDATAFATGPWQGQKELTVNISDRETNVRGVIPLDGIAPALAKLAASCPQK